MDKKSALVVVDVQRDFCPGGALAVPEGDRVVPALNGYIERFASAGLPVYATRDRHPARTVHFKEYGGTWPAHCVMDTPGAEFHPDLRLPGGAVIITKGTDPARDSYSGFDGADPEGRGLAESLRARGVGTIYVGGLATDYCVRATVLDGLKNGFKVTLLVDAVRGVDVSEGDSERAVREMEEAGARTVTIEDLTLE
ncbi:MAG: nicotinamidase [Thermodesulfobacteriota bacterium]